MLENKLLQAFIQDRNAFDLASGHLTPEDFSSQGKVLYQYIEEFYGADATAQRVDKDVILSRIQRELPKFVSLFEAFLSKDTVVSIPNILEEVIAIKRHQIGLRLSSALIDGNSSLASKLMDEYNTFTIEVEEDKDTNGLCVDISVRDVLESFTAEHLVPIYPEILNDAVGGGIPKQTHIVIFATPETGKTLFSISLAAHFCTAGLKVLYVGNEDPKQSMLMRFINNFTGLTRQESLGNIDFAEQSAQEAGLTNLLFKPASPGTIAEIEKLIIEYEPDILVVDQIRKLAFPGIEGDVAQLSAAGEQMRRLIKKYDLIGVSITQASDSARGKAVLDMGDVYMSKTGLPGDADILIGIGADAAMLQQNRRLLSLCKNKINGNHACLPITVNPLLSRVL